MRFRLLKLLTISPLLLLISCNTQEQPLSIDLDTKKARQDSIIMQYATNGAHKYNYSYELPEWQEALDAGLQVDSTIAYLWQQKAMPYFKSRKYEVDWD